MDLVRFWQPRRVICDLSGLPSAKASGWGEDLGPAQKGSQNPSKKTSGKIQRTIFGPFFWGGKGGRGVGIDFLFAPFGGAGYL